MFMTPGEGLAFLGTSWVLLLEQESYLPYIKKVMKDIYIYIYIYIYIICIYIYIYTIQFLRFEPKDTSWP